MGTTTAIVAIVLGSLTLLGSLSKFVRIIYKWGRRCENALAYIEAEMKHNGGDSMRDHMVKTSERVESIEKMVNKIRDERYDR